MCIKCKGNRRTTRLHKPGNHLKLVDIFVLKLCDIFIKVCPFFYPMSKNLDNWFLFFCQKCQKISIFGFFFCRSVVMQPSVNPNSNERETRMEHALGLPTTRFHAVTLSICGVAMALLQIVCVIVVKEIGIWDTAHQAGTGIWCGVFITATGALASCSAKFKRNGVVRSDKR